MMKKEYRKPYLLMESFQLNAAIATTCSANGGFALHYGENSCDDFGENEAQAGYFGNACAEAGGFNVVVPGGEYDDQFCYHAAVASLYLAS